MTDKPTPTDAALQSIIDDADAGPPTDKAWLCLECGRWTPWRHEEAHDHADGCKAPAIYAAKRDWKTRLKDYMAKWGQPAQSAEPFCWHWENTFNGGMGAVKKNPETLGINMSHPDYKWTALYTAPQPVAREPQCWCLTCRPMRFEDPYSIRMALCPTCGNKRCPKANDHRNTCTGSNEPGQPGSAYFGGIKGGQHGDAKP